MINTILNCPICKEKMFFEAPGYNYEKNKPVEIWFCPCCYESYIFFLKDFKSFDYSGEYEVL